MRLTPSLSLLFLVIVPLVCGSALALERAEKNLMIEQAIGKGGSLIVVARRFIFRPSLFLTRANRLTTRRLCSRPIMP